MDDNVASPKIDYQDTYMFDNASIAEDDIDTGESILKLNEALAVDIINDNIIEDLESPTRPLKPRINYATLFKQRVESMDPSDPIYNQNYILDQLAKIGTTIATELKKRYDVELGTDLDFENPYNYLDDMETLYEFLYVRQYENLVDYIEHMIAANRQNFIATYKKVLENSGNKSDIFLVQDSKKFKNSDDALILHYMTEIIHDIIDSTNSAYDLFKTIAELDVYEEFNYKMDEMIINYGTKLVLNNDAKSAELYMAPMKILSNFTEIKNEVVNDYLEKCELDDEIKRS